MNRLIPQSIFAEDQPHAHTILATHVLLRGFQSGALLGLPIGLAGNFFLRRRRGNATIIPLAPSIIRASGVSAVFGTGLLGLALIGRMWGRDEIEWKDRTWRLLGNRGQNEMDEWTATGMVAGLGAFVVGREGGWKMGVGSVGLGGTVGLLGYIAYRHGVKGGEWDDIEGV